MRLRVRIERQALPTVQAIWPITDPSATVAQLLDSLNGVFPLEGNTWGLEDYSVALHGFELLHYHELAAVCKDDDEIVVKPLSYRDVRARYATGRHQITPDGRHLLDGIPFGRPALRAPRRPELDIPPRVEGEDGSDEAVLLLTEDGEQVEMEDEDDGEDGDFRMDGQESDENLEDADIESGESSEDESSSDTTSEDSNSGDSSSSESATDSESSGSSASGSEQSWDGLAFTPAGDTDEPWEGISPPPASEKPHDHQSIASSPLKRPLDVENDQVAGDDGSERGRSSKLPKLDGLPFQGLNRTKTRNARRRDTKRLRHLIDTGLLPAVSTLEDLRQYDGGHQPAGRAFADAAINGEHNSASTPPVVTGLYSDAASPANLEEQPRPKTQKKKDKQKVAKDASDLEARRQILLAQIADGGVDVTPEHRSLRSADPDGTDEDDGPPQVMSSKAPLSKALDNNDGDSTSDAAVNGSAVDPDGSAAEKYASELAAPPAARRFKLDVAGSTRLLFGSLGVRVPKTQEDKDRLQHRLAGRAGNHAGSTSGSDLPSSAPRSTEKPAADVPEEVQGDDMDAWRSKIRLTAVECIDDGVALSEPPFPFYKRWDQRQKPKKSKKRKTGAQSGQYVETYDKYNADGNGDALDYDDPEVEESEYWEDGALLVNDTSGGEADGEVDGEVEEDNFPPLPANVADLPSLQREEVQQGDYVVFTELACDATTNWMPKMATRSAKIVSLAVDHSESDSTPMCLVELARRDLARVEYDEDGNRLYSKFEMPDEEEVDDATLLFTEKSWDDMIDMRLLQRSVVG